VSFSSEKALLSVCLRDPVCVDEAVALGVKRDHFDHMHYRILWAQFAKDRTAGIGPDRATLFDRFEDRIGEGKKFDSYQTFGAIVEAIEHTPATRKNVEAYVGAIVEAARRRHIVRLAHTVIACEQDKEPFSEILKYSASIATIATWAPEGRSEPRIAHDLARDYLEDLEAQRLGLRTNALLKTGIESLDNILYVRPGQMVVIGGRPKMGKTHLMISILRNIARIHDRPTLFVSAEMNEMQIGERIASSEALLGETAADVAAVREKVLKEWENVPIYFDDKPKSLGAALMSIRLQKRNLDISAAAIDYLQLLKLLPQIRIARTKPVSPAAQVGVFVIQQRPAGCKQILLVACRHGAESRLVHLALILQEDGNDQPQAHEDGRNHERHHRKPDAHDRVIRKHIRSLPKPI